MEQLETKVPPPVWAAVSGVLMFGISRLGLGYEFSGAGVTTGTVVAIIGVIIAVLGFIDVTTAHTTVDPHDPTKTTALVEKGMFRFTRNPMYLGMAVVLGGFGIALGDVVAVAIGVGGFVAVITRLQIIPEERILLKRFPKRYPVYAAGRRRWL